MDYGFGVIAVYYADVAVTAFQRYAKAFCHFHSRPSSAINLHSIEIIEGKRVKLRFDTLTL